MSWGIINPNRELLSFVFHRKCIRLSGCDSTRRKEGLICPVLVGVIGISLSTGPSWTIAPVFVAPEPEFGVCMQTRFEGVPACLGQFFDRGFPRDWNFGKVSRDVSAIRPRQAFHGHQRGTCAEGEFGGQPGDGCEQVAEAADDDGVLPGLEIEIDQQTHFSSILEMSQHAEHGPLLRKDLLAEHCPPGIKQRAKERVFEILGYHGKDSEMTAGELAEPLEVSPVKAEVNGGMSLRSVRGQGVEPLGGDDLIQDRGAQIPRPEEFQRGAGECPVRLAADGVKLTIGKPTSERTAEIGKGDLAAVTVEPEEHSPDKRGQGSDPAPGKQ